MTDEALARIARRHGIRLILQFGSTVSGRTHERSDLDIAVLLDAPSATFRTLGEISADLQTAFPDREIDLAILNTADPLFLKRIVDDAKLLYGEARTLARLRMYAFTRYQDHRRFLEMERAYVRRKAAGR